MLKFCLRFCLCGFFLKISTHAACGGTGQIDGTLQPASVFAGLNSGLLLCGTFFCLCPLRFFTVGLLRCQPRFGILNGFTLMEQMAGDKPVLYAFVCTDNGTFDFLEAADNTILDFLKAAGDSLRDFFLFFKSAMCFTSQ